jgi:AcrR family transcriptional regulator
MSTVATRISDDAILDGVIAALIEHGYAGATTRVIASTAGVNEVTLFRRFESKQALMLAAIQRDTVLAGRSAMSASGDLEADLLAVLEYFVEVYRAHARLPLVLILEASRNPELESLMRGPLTLQRELRKLIATYQQSGELIDEPPAHTANALVGPLLAYGADAQLGIAATDGPPEASELLTRFLDGHRAA